MKYLVCDNGRRENVPFGQFLVVWGSRQDQCGIAQTVPSKVAGGCRSIVFATKDNHGVDRLPELFDRSVEYTRLLPALPRQEIVGKVEWEDPTGRTCRAEVFYFFHSRDEVSFVVQDEVSEPVREITLINCPVTFERFLNEE